MVEQLSPNNETVESVADRLHLPASIVNSTGFLLNRAARRWRDQIASALAPCKLTTQELGLLRIIDEQGPLSQQELGKKNLIDRTTIVHLLDGLEERKLTIRVRNQVDRRSHLLYLTPRGKKTLARAAKIVEKLQEHFFTPLSPQECAALKQTLLKLLIYQAVGEN